MNEREFGDPTALLTRALRVTPGGVHSPVRAFGRVGGQPFFTRHASGAVLTDTAGRRYLDFCMAFGPLILGHQDPAVAEEVRRALADGWSYGTAEPWSLELAELITSIVPWAEQIRFVNSGTEAVMSALRVARGATGRSALLKFDGCYHGHVDSMLIRAGSGLATAAVPDSAGIPAGVAADTLVAHLDDEAGLRELFNRHGDRLAAAIIEPLPANFGLLPQQRSFLATLRELCTKHGSLLIFDEVISGFRVGLGGCAGQTGIEPDLVTYGKIIGGGFPVGACAGRRALMQQLAPVGPVYQAGTMSANPLAMRAGLATLRRLIDGSVYAALERRGRELENALVRAGWRVQREGSIFWIAGRGDAAVSRAPQAVSGELLQRFPGVFRRALAAGVYLPPSPYEVCFLSAAHTDEDIGTLVAALGNGW